VGKSKPTFDVGRLKVSSDLVGMWQNWCFWRQ